MLMPRARSLLPGSLAGRPCGRHRAGALFLFLGRGDGRGLAIAVRGPGWLMGPRVKVCLAGEE